jgi:hypothetical protein
VVHDNECRLYPQLVSDSASLSSALTLQLPKMVSRYRLECGWVSPETIDNLVRMIFLTRKTKILARKSKIPTIRTCGIMAPTEFCCPHRKSLFDQEFS